MRQIFVLWGVGREFLLRATAKGEMYTDVGRDTQYIYIYIHIQTCFLRPSALLLIYIHMILYTNTIPKPKSSIICILKIGMTTQK